MRLSRAYVILREDGMKAKRGLRWREGGRLAR